MYELRLRSYFARPVIRGYGDFVGVSGVRVPGERHSGHLTVHLVLYDHSHVAHQRFSVVPWEHVTRL